MRSLKTTSAPSLFKLRDGIKRFVAVLAVTATTAYSAHAQLINIGTTQAIDTEPATGYMTGSAVLGTTLPNSTDTWNTLDLRDQQSFSNLSNANGNSTSVSLTVTGFQGVNVDPNSDGNLAPALFENFAYEFLANGGQSTMDFSGLADSATYELAFYNLNDGTQSDTTYTINGVTSTLEATGSSTYTSTPTVNLADPGAVYSGNYILLTGTTDALGNLDLTMGVAPSANDNPNNLPFTYMAFNGLQIEEVPEPSTFALMAAGAIGLAFLVRRKRSFLAPRG